MYSIIIAKVTQRIFGTCDAYTCSVRTSTSCCTAMFLVGM